MASSHAGTRLPIAAVLSSYGATLKLQNSGRSPCFLPRRFPRGAFSHPFLCTVRLLFLTKEKTELFTQNAKLRLTSLFRVTSYGGIIRIRSRVEVWLLPLSPPHELPCVLFFVGYCTPAGAKKQEQVFLSPFCRLFAKSLLQFPGLCYTCPKFRSARGSHSPLWGTARHKRRLKLWVSSKQPWARHPA